MQVLKLFAALIVSTTLTGAVYGQTPVLPLGTCGRWIVDSLGQRVKLAAVNWYGANDELMVAGGLDKVSLDQLAATIRKMGFNAVRLPYSNTMLHQKLTSPAALSANPQLLGLSPLEVFDRTITALTALDLMVILDDHQTSAAWCCDAFDSDGLWFNEHVTLEDWIGDWEFLARRYRDNPRVVGAELRNELRPGLLSLPFPLPLFPTWGDGSQLDWHLAATQAGNRILAINPYWLIVVDGLSFGADLSGVQSTPVLLDTPDRVVYGAHTYPWFRPSILHSYAELDEAKMREGLDSQFGFIATQSAPAPIWVNEFGDKQQDGDRIWWQRLVRYLKDRDLDWAYWPLNGGRNTHGAEETYGLLQPDWTTPSSDDRLPLLQTLVPATTGPQLGQVIPGCAPRSP